MTVKNLNLVATAVVATKEDQLDGNSQVLKNLTASFLKMKQLKMRMRCPRSLIPTQSNNSTLAFACYAAKLSAASEWSSSTIASAAEKLFVRIVVNSSANWARLILKNTACVMSVMLWWLIIYLRRCLSVKRNPRSKLMKKWKHNWKMPLLWGRMHRINLNGQS